MHAYIYINMSTLGHSLLWGMVESMPQYAACHALTATHCQSCQPECTCSQIHRCMYVYVLSLSILSLILLVLEVVVVVAVGVEFWRRPGCRRMPGGRAGVPGTEASSKSRGATIEERRRPQLLKIIIIIHMIRIMMMTTIMLSEPCVVVDSPIGWNLKRGGGYC